METEQSTELVTVNSTTSFAAERPTQSVMMISSEMALRLLDRNVKNRTISAMSVEVYRRDMAAGRWLYAADPIRFDTNGQMQDGQHRMLALSQCEGLTLPFLVVKGLTPEAQGVMDHGRKRLAYQQLAMKGFKNSTKIAAIVKLYIAWDEGLLFKDTSNLQLITVAQIEGWVDEHPILMEQLNSLMGRLTANDASPSTSGTAALIFLQIDPDAAIEFFTLLVEGAGTAGHPIVTLDKRLQRMRREGLKMPQRDYLALFILAWNAWRQNRSISKFQRPRGGAWSAQDFPEPVVPA